MISLPASFFLNGWIHALSAAEITTYLMLRDLEARYPRAGQAGVYANNPQREKWYGIHRDVYASHRQLAAYRLVDRLNAPARNPDGTIASGGGQQMLQPYWFRTTPEGFDRAALPTVVNHLNLLWPLVARAEALQPNGRSASDRPWGDCPAASNR